MKLFRECFGGTATVNPAAEERGGRRQTEGHAGDMSDKITSYNNNKSRRLNVKVKPSSTITPHWQPKLHAISEDHPMPDKVIGRPDETHERKRPVKVKAKSTAKAVRERRQPSQPDDDYWKYSNVIAMPAFSPTPFVI